MSSEKLQGAEKSKTAIENFDSWLKKNCKEKKPLRQVLAEYQILSGHAYRKLHEWLTSLKNSKAISVFEDSGETYVICVPKPEVKKPKMTKIEKYMEKVNLRERMKAGYCKNQECPPFSEEGCENCNAYRDLKDKGFLEEE